MRFAIVFLIGCSGGADDPPAAPKVEPKLAAACTTGSECPATYSCFSSIGCVRECPSGGIGEAHGCPANGFCYIPDPSVKGYCALMCETDADCTNVNKELSCKPRAATAESSKKVCVTSTG